MAPSALRRLVANFEGGKPLGELASALLPPVQFEEWYAAAQATQGSFVGSGRLDWPTDRAERVALHLELLKYCAKDDRGIIDFCRSFMYVENDFGLNTAEFLTQIVHPFYKAWLRVAESAIEAEGNTEVAVTEVATMRAAEAFVDEGRIAALSLANTTDFDMQRIVRLCEELNICWNAGALMAVAMLTRAIIDHVPPLFGKKSFTEVASNYAGAKSFKDSMTHLESSARKIGDTHLHVQIRKSETLPTQTQVNFSRDLDVLLGEICRLYPAAKP